MKGQSNSMSVTPLGLSAAFLYIESLTLLLPGYIYWLVLTRLVPQEVVGSFSTVVSLSGIMSSIIMLGIPVGCQRFISKSLSEKDYYETRLVIESSVIVLTIVAVIWSILMIFLNEYIIDRLNLSLFLIVFLVVLTYSTSYYTLFRGFVLSTLKTKIIGSTTIVATAIKFVSAIGLILLGHPYLGISAGIILFAITASLFLIFDIVKLLQRNCAGSGLDLHSLFNYVKKVIAASLASWIPSVVTVIGTNLGTVVVNSVEGPSSAAVYFIAFAVVTAISGISSVFFSIGYPVLSAMKDGRKRSAVRMIRICLMILMPITFSVLFYSHEIMAIFGGSYIAGGTQLGLLLLSVFPVTLSGFMTILAYSYGKYKETLLMGVGITLPRVLLYFLFVPAYGAEGAALGYLAGSWIGLIPALLFASRITLQLNWKSYLGISLVPLLISLILSGLHFPAVIGILGTMLISSVSFISLRIADRGDIVQFLAVLPRSLKRPVIIDLGFRIAKKMNPSF